MLSIDGVLYHAVDINDMPENAVVFAAPNNNFNQPPYILPQQQMIESFNNQEALDQADNLDKILREFQKDRK